MSDEIDRCLEMLQKSASEGGLETKSQREELAIRAAECGAMATCSAYYVPPNMCKGLGNAVGKYAVETWNKVFGNSDEWEAYLRRKAATSAYFDAREHLDEVEIMLSGALYKATTAIIQTFDKAVPDSAGKLGGGKLFKSTFGNMTVDAYQNDQPARLLLQMSGLMLTRNSLGLLEVPPWRLKITSAADAQRILKNVIPAWILQLGLAQGKALAFIATKSGQLAAMTEASKQSSQVQVSPAAVRLVRDAVVFSEGEGRSPTWLEQNGPEILIGVAVLGGAAAGYFLWRHMRR